MNIFYNKHKERYLKENRQLYHWLYFWNFMQAQFVYKGLPETLPAEYIEGILMTTGMVGVGEIEGKLYAASGGYVGQLNGYLPEDWEGAVQGKQTIRGFAVGPAADTEGIEEKDTKKIVVGWNNAMRSPDIDIFDLANTLTEIQTSEDINLMFSRLLRIPIARNSKEKAIIESAIKAIIEGKIEAVSSAVDSLENLVNGEKPMQFLDLVDAKDVDKLQYLNQFNENKLKRFFHRHGFSYNVTNKLAQQSNAEMHGGDDVCIVYPLQQFDYRKKFIEMLNDTFGDEYGFEASVEMGEMLKNSYDKAINYIPDELNEKGIVADNIEESEGSANETDNNDSGTSNSDSDRAD